MSGAVAKALMERRAIRRYLPQPVPDELVRAILSEARWAPSATNTQSTYVYVLEGEPLARLKADMRAYAESEAPPAPDLGGSPSLPAKLKARQEALFKTRMEFIAAEDAKAGVKPADPPVPPAIAMADIFGTSVLLVLAVDKGLALPYGCFDAGLFAQSIALSAHEHGLGTCIAASFVRYPDLVRREIPGLDGKDLLMAIALGYPDMSAPVNRFPRNRIPVEEFTTFVR
jgi:nitroreductase